MIDRSIYGRDGMFFPSIKEKNKFRDFIYDKISIKLEYDDKNIIKTCIIIRDGENNNRNIKKLREVILLLKNVFSKLYIISFDSITIDKQITTINSCTLIITSHGASIMNILWILKKRVIIISFLFRYNKIYNIKWF